MTLATIHAVTLTLADGEAREAKTYPLGDYSCPFCGSAQFSPEGWAEHERLNAECYAKTGEAYDYQPYPRYMAEEYERRGCGNPACWVNMNAAQLAEARERIARREAEEAARKRNHELAMQRIKEAREAEYAAYSAAVDKAREEGYCEACTRHGMRHGYRPKFIRHRNPDNCPQARN